MKYLILTAFVIAISFGFVGVYIAKLGHDAPRYASTHIEPIAILVCPVSCGDVSDTVAQVNAMYHQPFWARAAKFRGLALYFPARQLTVTKPIVLMSKESLNGANLTQPPMISFSGHDAAIIGSQLESSRVFPRAMIEIDSGSHMSIINNNLIAR